jgi:hypothetical protein
MSESRLQMLWIHGSIFGCMYSPGQKKVGQVLLRNLAKTELSKPGLLVTNK